MTTPWPAGHLPGLDPAAVRRHVLAFAAHGRRLEVAVPVLDAAQAAAVARHVRQHAQRVLQALPVDAIVAIVDGLVHRLLDRQDPLRRELDDLLPVVTGFDPELLQLNLTAYLQAFRAPQLHRFLAEDFPNPKVLDGFQPAPKGGAVRAFGPALLGHVWAGNVPGLPLWSLACGLLVKAGNVGKLPSAEPVFATALARALAQAHPPLADCFAVTWWQGGADDAGAATLLAACDTVLAYGGSAALAQVRSQLPATTRFLGYGHKLGVALVGRDALDRQRGPAQARLAALDIARHEQQGCYSPHAVYVEAGGAVSPREFARYLAAELAQLAVRHPRRALPLDEAAGVAAWRQAMEWREGVELLGDAQAPWAVAHADRPLPLAPTGGHRCVQVSAVASLDDVLPLLGPHAAVLQTVGLATRPDELYRLAGLLGQAGATRIAPLGGMAQPEPGWHHDGRYNLADLVRLVEIEQAAERAADRCAPYWQEDRP